MILEDAILQYLSTFAPLVELLGIQDSAPAVFTVLRPQASTLPCVLVTRTQTERQTLFCGTDNLLAADFQIDSYASDGTVYDVAVQVRKALLNYVGTMGTDSPGVYVDQVRLQNEFPLVDPDPGVIRMSQLFNFWYQEDQQ